MSKTKQEFAKHRWSVVNSYLNQYMKKQLLQHQFQSYEYFMETLIPEKIYSYNPLIIHEIVKNTDKKDKSEQVIHIEIYFENHRFEDPTYNECNGKIKKMFPNDARLCNLTYSTTGIINLRLNIDYLLNGEIMKSIRDKVIPNVTFGKIPIMVGSKYCLLQRHKNAEQIKNECKYDKGGYTIVNGNEKVIISQEDLCNNRISVFEGKRKVKYDYVCSVRSMNKETKVSYKLYVMGSYNDEIVVKISHIKKEIPLFVFFRSIGLNSDKSIIRHILLDEYQNTEYLELLEPSVNVGKEYNSTESSLDYISKLFTIQMNKEDKMEYVKSFLVKNILPHIGNSVAKKQIFLGYMVKHLLDQLLEKRIPSDRDHYAEKRVEPPGVLMSRQFHYLTQKMIKDFKDSVIKDIGISGFEYEPDDLTIKYSILDNGFRYSLATGDWNVKIGNNNTKLMGVAQVLNRHNFLATLSHMRRINTPIDDTVKLIKPRQLHGTHFGKICPAETPEGGSVGAVKNLTMSASITIDTPIEPVLDILSKNGLIDPETINVTTLTKNHTKVFINGDLVGFHSDPSIMTKKLISIRRIGGIPGTQSIRYNINAREIVIYTDYGRCYQPFFIVKDNKINMTDQILSDILANTLSWNDLLEAEVIEYLDTEEEESSLIAMNVDYLNNAHKHGTEYTHCEIDESFSLLGVCASLIPASDHNQSPRNAYQSSMCKQAIGIYASNHSKRFDTIGYVLSYPQVPLVQNQMSKHVDYDKLPCGQNIIVAFGCWSGFNQEDSVIFNKSAIDRGLFECFTYRTYKSEESRKSTTMVEEKFCNPKDYDVSGVGGGSSKDISESKHGDYSKLNSYGFVDLNTDVIGDDIIIGKIAPIIDKNKNDKNDGEVRYKDNSTALKSEQLSKIDKIIMTRNSDGYKIYKVKVRNMCTPTIGDKVSSRSGQKGTIGMIFAQEDMPVTENGLVPDLIINAHALPSRMTIGQLLETLLGICISSTGNENEFDTTAFQGLTVNNVAKELHSNGYNPMGNQTMINGQTGEEMKCQMFIGPTYYQRLKHMVSDKIHSRSRGPVQGLTRQGVEGRSRYGAGRFGERLPKCVVKHMLVRVWWATQSNCGDALNVELHIKIYKYNITNGGI